MRKESFIITRKHRKVLSLDKHKNSVKESDVLQLSIQRHLQERSTHKITVCSPGKEKRKSEFIGQVFKNADMNIQRRGSKMYLKTPSKLRLSVQCEPNPISDFQQNSVQYEFFSSLKTTIQDQVTKQLINKEIILKNHLNHAIIRLELFNQLIEKIVCQFAGKKHPKVSQQICFLDQNLAKIENLVKTENQKQRRLKNRIAKNVIQVNINNDINDDIKERQTEIIQLDMKKKHLHSDVRELIQEKIVIGKHMSEIKEKIYYLNKDIVQYDRNIEDLKNQERRIIERIKKRSEQLNKYEHDYHKLTNYVEKCSKNKHVQLASEDYKIIQSEIYEYAVYLQANQLATSFSYESIPLQNQLFIINALEAEAKDINKRLISDNLPPQDKSRTMRDFVLRIFAQHKRKDKQFDKVIEFKTKSICKFVGMMKKWLDNWTLKQEYLVGLRKQYSFDSVYLFTVLHQLQEERICSDCCARCRQDFEAIMVTFGKIDENYKMGNSFY